MVPVTTTFQLPILNTWLNEKDVLGDVAAASGIQADLGMALRSSFNRGSVPKAGGSSGLLITEKNLPFSLVDRLLHSCFLHARN